MSTDSGANSERVIVEDGPAARVADLVAPALEGLGYRLVRAQLQSASDQTLQIMAERPDGTMTVEDCETVSRQLSPLLDVHDPIAGPYRLEVSSPGIDRPLVRPCDFETWAGHVAKIEMIEPIDGRKRFRGAIEGFEDGEIRIEVDLPGSGPQVLGLPVTLVRSAHLVLTDALIRQSLRQSKAAARGIGDGSDAPDDVDFDGPDVDEDARRGGDALDGQQTDRTEDQ